jgi:hypothetical protein
VTRYVVDLTTMPEYGASFMEHGSDKTWEFALRSPMGCGVALLCDPAVVGADGEFLDVCGVALNELSGCEALRFQRANAGLDATQPVMSFVLYVDAAGVGATMRRSMKPIMLTLAQLRRCARARDNGAQLVG